MNSIIDRVRDLAKETGRYEEEIVAELIDKLFKEILKENGTNADDFIYHLHLHIEKEYKIRTYRVLEKRS